MQKVFYPVAKVGEITPGTGRRVRVGEDTDCVLFCTSDGEYYATGFLCPHQNEPLDLARLEACEVICRRHHLRFDLKSGDCTNAGGYWLRTLDVKIENGTILVGQWED
jgi:3-phenylpropionate/trans-cinnamate dioxygenase ferredoxin component